MSALSSAFTDFLAQVWKQGCNALCNCCRCVNRRFGDCPWVLRTKRKQGMSMSDSPKCCPRKLVLGFGVMPASAVCAGVNTLRPYPQAIISKIRTQGHALKQSMCVFDTPRCRPEKTIPKSRLGSRMHVHCVCVECVKLLAEINRLSSSSVACAEQNPSWYARHTNSALKLDVSWHAKYTELH